MDYVIDLLEMNPGVAVFGTVIFVLFFSNFLNFVDANHIEKYKRCCMK